MTAATLAASRSVAEQTLARLPHACNRGVALLEGGLRHAATCRNLAAELEELLADHTSFWLQRNRTGGLHDSLARLERLRADYTA